MRTYGSVIGLIKGNEFAVQLLVFALLLCPWRRCRRYFALRGIAALALYLFMSFGPKIPLPWYYLCIFCVMLFCVAFCFDCGIYESLYLSLNMYCVQHIVSGLSYATAYIAFDNGARFSFYYIVAGIYMLVGCALTGVFGLYRSIKNPRTVKIDSPLTLFVAALFLTVAIFISHYAPLTVFFLNMETQAYLKLFTALFGCAMLMGNIMNGNNSSLKSEKNILELLLRKDKDQYEQARLSAERISIKYHDLRKKVNLGIITEEEMREIDSYAEYYTGNRALDIVLTETAVKCKERDIRLLCTADGGALGNMRPYHIYSLLANCLENAIEGLENAEQSKREIRLSVERVGDMCVIRIENYFKGKCIMREGIPQTTKRDHEDHGYGVKSILNIAEKYNGRAYFSAEDGLFVTLIIMPEKTLVSSDNE